MRFLLLFISVFAFAKESENIIVNYKEEYISVDSIEQLDLEKPEKNFNLNQLKGKDSSFEFSDKQSIDVKRDVNERYLSPEEIKELGQ